MNVEVSQYNVRVYGVLLNEKQELLLSKEQIQGQTVLKFPGGGHELGEGLVDCLKREFLEELEIEVINVEHFYTTDFFQRSAFDQRDQLISVYYLVKVLDPKEIQNGQKSADADKNEFYWKKLNQITSSDLNFPIDQKVLALLKEQNSSRSNSHGSKLDFPS